MRYIDLHCDSLLKIFNKSEQENLFENNNLSVDFKSLQQGEALAQFFAIFMPDEETLTELKLEEINDDLYIDRAVNILEQEVTQHNQIVALAKNYQDIIVNQQQGKISALLTIEDGRSVAGNLDKLKRYYKKGIRLITLTWNYENCFGYPNSTNPAQMARGLKDFGIEAVQYMNQLGMLIDVSHLSDGGFYDVAQYSSKPFIASHSNARSLANHPRNLTDQMIIKIAEKGGVIGLNFAPYFLNKDSTNSKSSIERMIAHLNYLKNIGGENVLALGTDFDGIHGNLEIASSKQMPLLFKALARSGWNIDLIEKFAFKNSMRVIKEVLS
ncbi:dipeptidase [Halanaerobium salsuginis]|jgi:membrane dipeptidase|uniref:Membrane dipeptidase n=1 Tax=Halanaerobium salsuginis TaxID=29563 RepID=A0A1I4JK37_9FIRM|nr:dipeptidase [Halanaerobium salsuginis]SFL66955.1 membrane dipeptidase [Halanaerobium salsuginis]